MFESTLVQVWFASVSSRFELGPVWSVIYSFLCQFGLGSVQIRLCLDSVRFALCWIRCGSGPGLIRFGFGLARCLYEWKSVRIGFA